jgi:hypothetical protein
MPKASSSRASPPQQDLLRLAHLLQRPVNDAAAADELVKGVLATLTYHKVQELASGVASKKAVSHACVAAALQCAGWLVAARRAQVLSPNDFGRALATCMLSTTTLMAKMPAADLALLQAVMQPSGGGHVPGGCADWWCSVDRVLWYWEWECLAFIAGGMQHACTPPVSAAAC